MRKALLVVWAVVGLGGTAWAQQPPVLIYGNSSGTLVPVKVSSDGTMSGGASATTDTDDGSIAGAQVNSLANSLTMAWDGSVWRRLTFGTAGTASAQVLTVQGVASMTPILATATVASGGIASGAYAVGAGTDGWDATIGTKADAANVATDTTPITAMNVWKQISASAQSTATNVALGVASNTQSRRISLGATEDEWQVKATPGVLAGLSATNNHASAVAFLKCSNLTAANTTPGTSAVFYSILVPFGSGVVDRNIEVEFSVALTCYIVLGEADTDVAEVAANDVHVNLSYR